MLRAWVVPHLKWEHSVTVVGLASRTGAVADNQHLSWLRCQKTLDFLRAEVGPNFAARPAIGFGELKAKQEGYADNSEDPRFRSVVILVGPRETPPFPPGLIDVTPTMGRLADELLPEESFDFGKAYDIVSGIVQFVELLPWEKIAMVAEQADPVLTLVGGFTGMPLLWRDVHQQNLINGRLEGFWQAMQDMATRYSDPNLSGAALSTWPPLVAPPVRPMPPLSGQGVNEREWLRGRAMGRDLAYALIEQMERDPPIREHWQITGRRHLFLLSQRFGTGVGAAMRGLVETRLRERGKSWPLSG